MGKLIDKLASKDENKEYKEASTTESTLNSHSDTRVQLARVRQRSDLLQVEEAVNRGEVLIVKFGNLQPGLTKDDAVDYLKESVEKVRGDMAWCDSEELVIVPFGGEISRNSI